MFKTVKDGKMPTKGSEFSACVDLYAREDIEVKPSETTLIPLGVCLDLSKLKELKYDSFDTEDELEKWMIEFKKSHYVQLMLRSSLSKKLIIANGVGIIDIDYEDEMMIRVHNPLTQDLTSIISLAFASASAVLDETNEHGDKMNKIEKEKTVTIKKGDRVAQIALLNHNTDLFGITSDEKRVGGFGSTGKN